jgi:hypothetical protein
MRFSLPLFFLLSISFLTKGQSDLFGTKGTYIVSAICKDGIVSAADSKTRFYLLDHKTGKNREVGYYNNGIKLVRFREVIVSAAGQHFFDFYTLRGYSRNSKFIAKTRLLLLTWLYRNCLNLPSEDLLQKDTSA